MTLISPVLQSQDCIPTRPPSTEAVHQFGGAVMLSASEEQRLNNKLKTIKDSSSVEIAVVIVPTLCGMDPNQYATELGEDWGVGDREVDNGIVLMVKPKTGESSEGRGQVYIATGYGSEGAVPDITAGRIVDYEIIPHFRNGDFYKGLDAGVHAIALQLAGEYDASEDEFPPILFFALIVALVLFVFIMARYGGRNGGGPMTTTYSGRGWTNHRGNPWIMTGGSGGGGGGFGGGGFGGFSGGSFGGGGAGGSW